MKRLSVVALVFTALAVAACGYQFTGGGPLPGGIRRVFVPMAKNRTSESGLESAVTNALRYEITSSGNLAVGGAADADALLKAEITTVTSETVSRATTTTSLERQARLTVTIDYEPTDPAQPRRWAHRKVSATETYAVASDRLATDRNRRLALEKAANRLAKKVMAGISADF